MGIGVIASDERPIGPIGATRCDARLLTVAPIDY